MASGDRSAIIDRALRRPDVPPSLAAQGWSGTAIVIYEVRSDGSLGEVRTTKVADPLLVDAIRRWLAGCRMEPAVIAGKAASSIQKYVVSFRPPSQRPVRLLDAGITRPIPENCGFPHRPQAGFPDLAATVLAEYQVNEDGTVSDVFLRNADAPPALFELVRDWLLACRFDPAWKSGEPVAVRIIQPFVFH
jgi:hypothetical protein